MKDKKRFVAAEKDKLPFSMGTEVIVDRLTGVQYLFVSYGYGGGLTVLVDREGKPLLYRESPEL